ncbi:MAG: hypothetical protein M3N32_00500 [Actinomycetota bacterium]|nr:hypothetical protein [Actinomycetota bacterium]
MDAKLIRYADDIVIVSSKPVAERASALLAKILDELGLSLSDEKTRVTTAAEGFVFLAFRFQRRHSHKHGREVTYFSPPPEACQRARQRVRNLLRVGQAQGLSLAQMTEQVNLRQTLARPGPPPRLEQHLDPQTGELTITRQGRTCCASRGPVSMETPRTPTYSSDHRAVMTARATRTARTVSRTS